MVNHGKSTVYYFYLSLFAFLGVDVKDDTSDRGFRFREALHGVTKAPEMGENNETEVWDPVLITESWAPNDPLVIW
jgi:hypothetical protein